MQVEVFVFLTLAWSLAIAKPRNTRSTSDACDDTVSKLTATQATSVVAVHNQYRGHENATDELQMKWSADLANRAQQLADKCIWDHGLTTDCKGERIGQNMYMAGGSSTSFPTVNTTNYIWQWYKEKANYHRDRQQKCDNGTMCGHYTQVAWAKSSEVGCGVAQCNPAKVPQGDGTYSLWSNAVIFVCNYSPAGNMAGAAVNHLGTPCSQCANVVKAGYKCVNKLCLPCNVTTETGCKCDQKTCTHGTWSSAECTCKCDEGWLGPNCDTKVHVCKDAYVDVCPTWLPYCTDDLYTAFMYDTCPQTCNMC